MVQRAGPVAGLPRAARTRLQLVAVWIRPIAAVQGERPLPWQENMPPTCPMTWLLRVLNSLTDGLWRPLLQATRVATLRPDWDAAPRTFGRLGWYAGVLLWLVVVTRLVQAADFGVEALGNAALAGGQSFLEFTLRMAFFACFYAALGRFVVFWNCIARSASPLALMGIVYSVSTVDQAIRLAIVAGTVPGESQQMLLGMKDVATSCLAVVVLVDFFRPRPPKKPRPRTESETSSRFGSKSTQPAPV